MADESELPRNSGAGLVTGVRPWVGDGEVGLVMLLWEVVALCGCCPGRLCREASGGELGVTVGGQN